MESNENYLHHKVRLKKEPQSSFIWKLCKYHMCYMTTTYAISNCTDAGTHIGFIRWLSNKNAKKIVFNTYLLLLVFQPIYCLMEGFLQELISIRSVSSLRFTVYGIWVHV